MFMFKATVGAIGMQNKVLEIQPVVGFCCAPSISPFPAGASKVSEKVPTFLHLRLLWKLEFTQLCSLEETILLHESRLILLL